MSSLVEKAGLLWALVLKQMVANPIKNYSSKDLAWRLEQRHPSVVVAVLAITIPFPERDNNASLPVSWDVACVPGRAQNCMQRHEYVSTSLEKFTMDGTDPKSFTTFQLVHRSPCFCRRWWITFD